jgi:Glycosyltransferase family 87
LQRPAAYRLNRPPIDNYSAFCYEEDAALEHSGLPETLPSAAATRVTEVSTASAGEMPGGRVQKSADRVIRWRASVRTAAFPAFAGIAMFGVAAQLVHFTHGERLTEYERFGRNILDGMIPYRDFRLEYPPASIPAFVIPAPGGGGYEVRFRIWMWILGAVTIVLLSTLRAGVGSRRRGLYLIALFVGVSPLLFDPSPLFNGFDFWPATLTLAALAFLLRGYRRTAAGTLGFAAAAKVYPVILFPLMLLFRRGRLSWRVLRDEITTFVGTIFVVNLPFAILGFHGLTYMYSRLIRRPLQIESLAGSLLLAAHQVGLYRPTVYVSFGGSEDLAGRLPDVLAPLSGVVMGAAVLAVWIVFARGPRGIEALLTAAAASVAAFIAFGKVFSPEYQVWLLAVVPLANRVVRLPALALLAASLVLTQLYFPSRYAAVAHLEGVDWFVVARNVTIVSLYVVLLVGLRRLSTTADLSRPGPSVQASK